ncbi:unnamed protein product [Eruca vesicaria subsp. sativa]|uniref:TPX2 C-terminal domain-containing protein n=1 Tax=Eruca vesicaria subsp. sativa TaxID=29727 RepID=A0ABC8KI79_ERUVS|nr:unnamed protein product [Eruca vesicaria subsp. sativa]
MGDMQVGVVANIDHNKGFYGLMEDKPVNPSLQVSVSFGRFENDSLSWEKFSAFSPNKYLEEVGKFATPGSVAQKKAYFEAHYKKVADRKAEIMDHQDKQMDKNSSFRSVVRDQGSVDGERSVTEYVVEEGCNGQEDKHVIDIATEVKEEVKNGLDSQRLENLEEIGLVEEKQEEVLQVEAEVGEEIQSNDTNDYTNEIPMKEMEKETTLKLTKKDEKRTRNSPKPDQVRTKPTTNKAVTSKKTPPSKEIKHMTKTTQKPAAPISIAPPRVYKPASKFTSLSTSQSSAKKEHLSSVFRNKQTAPKSLHMSVSLGPSASDPTALTSTRKSLIMERMGDKDIVKRAFKTFQKSYDFKSSVSEPKHQNAAKPTSSPSLANGRPAKASGMEKRSSTNTHGLKSNVRAEKQQKEISKSGARPAEKTRLQKNSRARVLDAKTRRESLNPKALHMQGSHPRPLQKSYSEKLMS